MQLKVSHDREFDSLEAKARWFQSLTLAERIEVFDEFTELALSVNPSLAHRKKHVYPPDERVRILRET